MQALALPLAGMFGFLAVALGAFGAHGLKTRLSPEMMTIYQTAVQYHFYHALALLLVALLIRQGLNGTLVTIAAGSYALGIVIFSGSLYALALSEVRILGAITPIGGVFFLLGWACLAIAGWKSLS